MGRSGPGYISPTVQREAIQRWADYRGVEIVAWHEDEDESGGTQDRPGLRDAMDRLEAHETDGIACWRLNRFARNVAGAISDVKRIQELGAHLAFVEEDIDPTGPFGSFILTVLLAVATLERDNMVEGWKVAKQRAIERGAKISPTSYGYYREPDGTLKPDPDQAPHAIEAFHLSASQGVDAAYAYLVDNAPGRTWTVSTVRRMLAKRVYLGESRYGDIVNTEAHEPLVSRATWEAAQHSPRRRRAAAHFPLSGIARCATCGSPMVGGRGGGVRNGESIRTYRCSASLTYYKGEKCKRAANIVADRLEAFVREALAPILDSFKVEARDANIDAVTLAERALAEAEVELDAFASDLTLRRALGHRYHDHLSTRLMAIETARDEYRALAKGQQARDKLVATDLLTLNDPRVFGELLRSILTSITVAPGRGAIEDRVRLVADHDLPTGPPLAPGPQ